MVPQAILVFLAALVLSEAAPVVPDAKPTHESRNPLSLKIVDAVLGKPAANVMVQVFKKSEDGSWQPFVSGKTSTSGEIFNFTNDEDFVEGVYRVEFATKAYWKKMGIFPFHENADVMFTAHDSGHRHYTIAVLLSPFSQTITGLVSNILN